MSLPPFSREGLRVAAYSRSTSGVPPLLSSGPGVRVTPSLAAYWAVPFGEMDRGETSLLFVAFVVACGVVVAAIVYDMADKAKLSLRLEWVGWLATLYIATSRPRSRERFFFFFPFVCLSMQTTSGKVRGRVSTAITHTNARARAPRPLYTMFRITGPSGAP